MKGNFFLLIIIISINISAQVGGRRSVNNQIPQAQTTPKAPEFKVKRYVGIVKYDVEKIIKKLTIKKGSKQWREFEDGLNIYNRNIYQIETINNFTLGNTKELFEKFQQKVIETGDLSDQQKVQQKLAENLKPVIDAITIEDKKLNDKIIKILSEKQYRKWVRYNKKLYKLIPKK